MNIDCHHPEVRPDHHEANGAYLCVLCGHEFYPSSRVFSGPLHDPLTFVGPIEAPRQSRVMAWLNRWLP